MGKIFIKARNLLRVGFLHCSHRNHPAVHYSCLIHTLSFGRWRQGQLQAANAAVGQAFFGALAAAGRKSATRASTTCSARSMLLAKLPSV